MKKCWNPDPKKRPLATDVCEIFNSWSNMGMDAEYFNQAEEIRLELIKSKMLGPDFNEKPHPKAIYTSRSITFNTKPNNKLIEESINNKGAIEKKREKEINPSGVDKFSYNLATILARDREVVAVNLRALSDGCEISIAKNSVWLDKDREYVEKIKETLKNVSKDAPISFKQTCGREDMRDLILTIVEYCSEKLRYTVH
ncbi:hypothetical protein RhiirB3_452111 [Rhizophagus irregularis]|nr:hypothetical protein RhiirB3_452111 [Rhizophagus irregularis]